MQIKKTLTRTLLLGSTVLLTKLIRSFEVVLLVALAVSLGSEPASASGVPYSVGDVFAAVGAGKIKHFSSTGVLLDTLDTTTGSAESTGMAFDLAGNLYGTQFEAGVVSKFDNAGNLLNPAWVGGLDSNHPESIVRDFAGNFYVGQPDGTHQVLKFSASGGAPIATFSPATESRGTDWVDLAADQCTLFYTSEGTHIKQFNVCTNTQLADFNAVPLAGTTAYAHRIRPNQEVLVADTSAVYRLNSSGAVIQTYTFAGTSLLFALNLDNDLTSFWTGDFNSGQVFKVDIDTGAVKTHLDLGYVDRLLFSGVQFGY